MGKEKYQKKISDLFKRSPVVSFDSIERTIREKGNIKQYSKQLVRNLLLKGKIRKLAKGFYSIHEDPSLNVFCFQPAYLGLQDSLSINNLWDQETIPIIITAKKIRQGLRNTGLGNILIRRINKKYIFGVEYEKSSGFYFPYSDKEKTLIDMVYFRQKISKETMENIKQSIDKKKLEGYLKEYPERFRARVEKVLE